MEHRNISRLWQFNQGRVWVIEESYDVVFEDVG